MRIIAGERRGHKFDGPKVRSLRPTSDIAREAIFNILRDDVEGRPVLDVFAGTGALGLEALSRGATSALFIERDRDNLALIRRNIAALRFEDRGFVLSADAYRWAKTFEPGPGPPPVVFLDPPWADYDDRRGRVGTLLADLLPKLPSESVVVVESGAAFNADTLPDLDAWDLRHYGGTHVAVRAIEGEPQRAPSPQREEET